MTHYATVLLTGATGFFGAHILARLLDTGASHVLCHVRAANATLGKQRLVHGLQHYRLWREEWRSRISALAGDLAAPQLGLGARFWELPECVEAIYHNGAQVNYLLNYTQLKPANVGATQDVLRLAQAARCPLFYVSSLRLFDHRLDGTAIREHDTVNLKALLTSGYAYSKAMAERLIAVAAAQGLNATILRPGLLCGDGAFGVPNANDAMSLLVRGCVQLGAAPVSALQVNLTSIAYAAQALVALSRDPRSHGGRWHLVHDEPTPVNRLLEAVEHQGFALDWMPYPEWVARLASHRSAGGNDLNALRSYFTPELPEQSTQRRFDSSRTRALLTERGIVHPSLDDTYLRHNIKGMVCTGVLPAPQARDGLISQA